MKKLVDKFKGLDYKQLGIEHGEKLVFGLVILIVVSALGGGTSWSHYANEPQSLEENVSQATETIRNTSWPKLHQARFPVGDLLTNRIQQMRAPLDSNAFAFGDVSPYIPLYKPKEKIKSPEWLTVEKLIASYALVALKMPRTAGFGGPIGDASDLPGDGPLALEDDLNTGMANTSASEVRGARVVAVRGVFPLDRQLIRIMRAMNISSQQNVLAELEFQDFEIERMTAVEGADPWSGKWDKIDLEEAFKILDEGIWIGDVVDTSITEAAFTEPLLELLSGPGDGLQRKTSIPKANPGTGGIQDDVEAINGYSGDFDVSDLGADNLWGTLATHPDVAEYHRTPEGQREQELINAAVLKNAKDDAPKARKPGALQGRAFNLRKMRGAALANQGVMDNVMRDIKQDSGKNVARGSVTASGKLLLFRFFDFSVEPGRAYRYRVRLKIVNPNFGKSFQDVVDPSVVEGEFRMTSWSNLTEPVLVTNEGDYFVSNVNTTGINGPEAYFDIFQWNQNTGTTVHGAMKRQLGQLIDGLADEKPKVVELGVGRGGTVDERHVEFRTGSVFIDVEGDRRLSKTLHPDLDIPFSGKLEIIDQVLITNEYGDLEPLDPMSRSEERASALSNHQAFLDKAGKPKAKGGNSDVDELAGGPDDPTDPEAEAGDDGSKRRRPSSRRRRGAK